MTNEQKENEKIVNIRFVLQKFERVFIYRIDYFPIAILAIHTLQAQNLESNEKNWNDGVQFSPLFLKNRKRPTAISLLFFFFF